MKLAVVPLSLLLGAVASPAAAECFTVYDSAHRIVYQSDMTPIDLSGPIGPATQARFPGGQLIISDDRDCTFVSPESPVAVLVGPAPAGAGGGTMSTVNSPAPAPSTAGMGSAPDASVSEGCRRGGYETRRGVPCDDAGVVAVPGVTRAPAVSVEGAARAPGAGTAPRVGRAR
jgi:hypothetical protein